MTKKDYFKNQYLEFKTELNKVITTDFMPSIDSLDIYDIIYLIDISLKFFF